MASLAADAAAPAASTDDGGGETKGAPAAGDDGDGMPLPFADRLRLCTKDKGFQEDPKGFMKKPDFKRAKQQVGGNKRKTSNFMGMGIGKKGFNKRFFCLDGMALRYYPDDRMAKESGAVHMSTINEVRFPSQIDDAPAFAIDLVSAQTVYTVAPESEAEQMQVRGGREGGRERGGERGG